MRDYSIMALFLGTFIGLVQIAIFTCFGDGEGHPIRFADKLLFSFLFTIIVQLFYLTKQVAKKKD